MNFFRYQSDKIPVTLFLAYFFIDLTVYFSVESLWFLAVYFLAGLFPKACIGAWNHHHQHLATFRQPFLNRLLELVYTFQTGMSSHGWVLHHVYGHHRNYLDQTKDESRWQRADGSTMGLFQYSLLLTLTAYPRMFKVGMLHRKKLGSFLGMGGLSLALLSAFIYYNWINAFLVFILPMAASLYLTCFATYKHHSGLMTENKYHASYNIIHPVYNKLLGNLGYHTAHHCRPGLHWSLLPEYHNTITQQIPERFYLDPGFPWSIFLDIKEEEKLC